MRIEKTDKIWSCNVNILVRAVTDNKLLIKISAEVREKERENDLTNLTTQGEEQS